MSRLSRMLQAQNCLKSESTYFVDWTGRAICRKCAAAFLSDAEAAAARNDKHASEFLAELPRKAIVQQICDSCGK